MNAGSETEVNRNRWTILLVLCAVYMMSYIDRQLLTILAEPVRQELGLSDTQLGLLGGASFALFYTIAGVPIAWLADRANRVKIIATSCAVWSLFSAACGLGGSYLHLLIARIGVGIGEAGGTAPSYSVVSDLFRPHERGRAIALFALGSPIGVLVGTAIGAAIAASHGWRMAFIALGLPGVLLAAIVFRYVKEPIRGAFDSSVDASHPKLSIFGTIKFFVSARPILLMCFSTGITSFAGLGFGNWLPAYLMRSKGMTLSELSIYYSLTASASVIVGILGFGALADRFGSRDPRAYAWLPIIGLAAAIPCILAITVASDWRVVLALAIVPLACTTGQVPPAMAFVHNRLPADQRASVSAIFMLVQNIFGIGLGPLAVGMISDRAAANGFHDSLGVGMIFVGCFLIFPILLLLFTARAISRDLRGSPRNTNLS